MIEKLETSYKYYFINQNEKIYNALNYLNNNQDKCLVVIDKKINL